MHHKGYQRWLAEVRWWLKNAGVVHMSESQEMDLNGLYERDYEPQEAANELVEQEVYAL